MKLRISKVVRLTAAAFLCAAIACPLAGCGGSQPGSSFGGGVAKQGSAPYSKPLVYGNQHHYTHHHTTSTTATATYENPQWPTRNSTLLAVPDNERWYNAWGSAGTTCTITGPVVRVYQAKDENGMPIFIDIGAAYPNTNGVTLVVWGNQYYQFADMINAVDDGGAWLSVTGYLSVYDGHLQFDAGDGYVEYRWWTRVS